MKTRFGVTASAIPRWLVLSTCLFLAAGVGLAAGQSKKSASAKKRGAQAAALKHTKSAPKKKAKYVRVTGSNIGYWVSEGSNTSEVPLNVTVIDMGKAENRGYSSVMDVLRRNPAVYSSYRGY